MPAPISVPGTGSHADAAGANVAAVAAAANTAAKIVFLMVISSRGGASDGTCPILVLYRQKKKPRVSEAFVNRLRLRAFGPDRSAPSMMPSRVAVVRVAITVTRSDADDDARGVVHGRRRDIHRLGRIHGRSDIGRLRVVAVRVVSAVRIVSAILARRDARADDRAQRGADGGAVAAVRAIAD